jgi:DNA-binding PadR family transcriptional regulator
VPKLEGGVRGERAKSFTIAVSVTVFNIVVVWYDVPSSARLSASENNVKRGCQRRKEMRIASEQLIAGYSALEVRDFVRRYRFIKFFAEAAEEALVLSPRTAAVFMNKLVDLGFVETTGTSDRRKVFQVTNRGQALANASAARPIHRKTAERVLAQFLERVQLVNSTHEYAYRVGARCLIRQHVERH